MNYPQNFVRKQDNSDLRIVYPKKEEESFLKHLSATTTLSNKNLDFPLQVKSHDQSTSKIN